MQGDRQQASAQAPPKVNLHALNNASPETVDAEAKVSLTAMLLSYLHWLDQELYTSHFTESDHISLRQL